MTSEVPGPRFELPPEFVELLRAVTGRRARIVVEHILEHGYITTEELSERYGYEHPPRAARDVREQGIPLDTFSVTGTHGRTIAAYRFGDPSEVRTGRGDGRLPWPASLKSDLLDAQSSRCAICLTEFEPRYLQIDHRVPYEVGGDADIESRESFMLLCGSCNRAKSWSCEHCRNWTKDQLQDVCQTCYWANPHDYTHVAMRPMRRLDLAWAGTEVSDHDRLSDHARRAESELPEFVKQILRRSIDDGVIDDVQSQSD